MMKNPSDSSTIVPASVDKRDYDIFELSPDPILIVRENHFIDCNNAAVELLGFKTKQSLLDTHPSALSPEYQPDGKASRDEADQMMQKATEEGSVRFRWAHLTADGSDLYVEVTLTLLPLEGGPAIHAQLRLLDETLQRERALEEALHNYVAVLETTKDGYWMADLQGKILEVNQAYCDMSGFTKEELETMSIPDIEASESPEETRRHIEYIVKHGNDTFETKHRRKNGEVYDVEVTVSFSTINGGRFFVLVREITERKLQEKKMIKLKEEQLEQQKILLTQSKVAALGEMLSNIAHQWRQPLNTISLKVQKLKRNIDTGKEINKEQVIRCSEEVVEQVNYLSQTIDDFRDFFTADATRLARVSVKESIQKAEKLTADTLHHHYVTLVTELNDCTTLLNESTFIQGLINLINNAKDALVATGVPEENRYIFITLSSHDASAVISVKDSAGGIEESIMDKIFEPYFSTKFESQGTGIGLYMVNQIVNNQLKGSISVQNRHYEHEGKSLNGAEFIITIPCTKVPVTP